MYSYSVVKSETEIKSQCDKNSKELFESLKIGDKKSRNQIINQNLYLVSKEVKSKFKNSNMEEKDLISVGNIGLIRAVDTFSKSNQSSFYDYAIKLIDDEIELYIIQMKASKSKADISVYDEGVMDYYENNKIIFSIIRSYISGLTYLEKRIITMYFGLDGKAYNLNEIGYQFNLSRSTISKYLKESLFQISSNLKTQLTQYGISKSKRY